ncbi:hypothetical protein HEQ62_09340 [Haematospirillum jordaniae]|uniref:Uncharacterized protein n=1 Tax=Haematospirillum jordaniae TaxID=1549855 RepID=A0A143DCS1_9PROT|nr:hypothetical protein [Haematospirillum jordaniae]AMW34551.1 hypothetical protein AY555_04435 [Haematospirillum jordaniae]NKD44883.1 hypothetical protein [Haematospirillum jordaniae]NKD57908.1 hypothetical protein [Haematospirillum jordaniae]NKD59980.1 hypothetical protein [Haematospirillum jordaniae]NKD67918.1 hypothetical protein [Haematospirillum jordaniae]
MRVAGGRTLSPERILKQNRTRLRVRQFGPGVWSNASAGQGRCVPVRGGMLNDTGPVTPGLAPLPDTTS